MNPAKIRIEGNYWDCQIYRRRLYLFSMNGEVKIINWDGLIDSLISDPYLKIAMNLAFTNGSYLYNSDLDSLFQDEEIKTALLGKLNSLVQREILIDENHLNKFLISISTNPFNELQTDSVVYNNKFYAITDDSLLSINIHGKGSKRGIGKNITKYLDVYAFSISANKYAKLALSAGGDGLLEYNVSSNEYYFPYFEDDQRLKVISKRHSSFADYSFLSIYNSSLIGESFLAYRKWEENVSNGKSEIKEEGEISEKEIFKNESRAYLSWGNNEKIYRAVEGGVEIVNFNNYSVEDERFSHYKFVGLQQWKGKILSGTTAYYGTILHCENALVIYKSDGSFITIPKEVSRFRIYPRSINYENQLHVITDDSLEIYSFNHDYFINQWDKDFGIAFRKNDYRRTKSPF